MEKDCIHLTSEEKERLIEFKKSDKFLKNETINLFSCKKLIKTIKSFNS